VLAKKDAEETQKDKTSIIFSIKHEPGTLYRIIKQFHDASINLTKIESRPKKDTVWEYNFFADFEGHQKNPKIVKMLQKIKDNSSFLKVLGSYPVGH